MKKTFKHFSELSQQFIQGIESISKGSRPRSAALPSAARFLARFANGERAAGLLGTYKLQTTLGRIMHLFGGPAVFRCREREEAVRLPMGSDGGDVSLIALAGA